VGLVNLLVTVIADFVKENGSVHSGNSEHVIPLEGTRKCSICNDNGHIAFDSNRKLSRALRYVQCDKQDYIVSLVSYYILVKKVIGWKPPPPQKKKKPEEVSASYMRT
jgi:hypothetical protein